MGASNAVTKSGATGRGAELRHPTWRTRPRAHGDGGAALVEFALVMPVLFLILFGLVEFGVNVNDYQAMRQSVRDSARGAIVGDYGNGTCAPAAATAAANTAALQCTTRANASMPSMAVKVVFTDNNGSTDFSTDKVKICTASKARSITGIIAPFVNTVYLKSNVEMRAEKNLTLANAADNDPSGANWSWC